MDLCPIPSIDAESFRRAAVYVDKILKGTLSLQICQSSSRPKFELVINLKTAEQIGLTIPRNGCCAEGG